MRATVSVLVVGALLLFGTVPVLAKSRVTLSPTSPGGEGTIECLRVQRAAQAAVLAGMPFSNHGQLMKAVTRVVTDALNAGTIQGECAGCIISQFARSVPIGDQRPCGEEPRLVADLRGPDSGSCDGPSVGSTSIQLLASGDVEVRVVFVNGAPNTTFNVFWVCTDIPNGCHDDACGYLDIGDVATDAAGQAEFVTTLPGGSPFPGRFVHIDLCVPFCSGPLYSSVFGEIPGEATMGKAVTLMSGGDPTTKPVKPGEDRPWSLVKELYR